MKILLTVEFYEPHKGGAEEVVKQVAERLVQKGHNVTIATTYIQQRRSRLINGVRIEAFRISGNTVRGIKCDRKEIKRYQDFLQGDFDIMMNYAAQIWTSDLAFPVLDDISAKKIFVPAGYSALKNPDYHSYFQQLTDYLKKYEALVYHSFNWQDKQFGDEHGVGGKSVYIPNGAAEEEFLTEDNFHIKKRLGIKTPFLLATVANHYRAKGHKFVIDTFKKMNRRDASLLIVGSVPGTGFKSLLHLLLGCYKECRLASLATRNLYMVSGRNREVVLSAYKNADLFLFGSHIEYAPVVMYESFASKTPFITTNAGNVRDHEDCLKIVKTPDEMARVANRLLDSFKERKEMADKAFALWQKSHTWGKISEQYEGLFIKLVYAKS